MVIPLSAQLFQKLTRLKMVNLVFSIKLPFLTVDLTYLKQISYIIQGYLS